MKQLIFIHGRSQQKKDAVKLKQEWIEAWQKGLAKSGLSMPIDERQVRFPYYGDTLAQMVGGAAADDAAKIIVRGAEQNPAAEQFLSMLLQQYIDVAGITDEEIESQLEGQAVILERGPQNWGWVQAVLRAIDKRTPLGGDLIALVTNDVYQYLVNLDMRRHIEDGVLKAMDLDCDNVVVSHSLGTVVAYTSLRRLAADGQAWRMPLLVTLGSPLGIRAIRGKLRPIGHPACVAHWFNAYDPDDVVSLNPLDAKNFAITPAIENKGDVDNWTDNQHGIAGYLDDAVVARRIHEALM